MAYQLNEGQGSLFPNQKTNDRQPDFKGSIMIKGVQYNISAWNRTSQNGKQYISIQADERTNAPAPGQQFSQPQYTAPQPQPQPQYQAPAAPAPAPEDGPLDVVDDLPF